MASFRPLRYWHTLRHLRPGQIVGRVRFRLSRPAPETGPAPPCRAPGDWTECAPGVSSMTGPTTLRLLNCEQRLEDTGWNPDSLPKLWTYNLHYFGDLVAPGAHAREEWHRAIIQRWIAENAPGTGNGWEPYPTSLRIVNWIKWSLAGHTLSAQAVHSLAIQARWLLRRLEWHLLGNHLFVNAKALVFAGLFFDGQESKEWLGAGLRILSREIPVQVLPDGGQFELSPMYHALALEDMLDLLNIMRTYRSGMPTDLIRVQDQIVSRIPAMRRWLSVMTHPDGEIAFFNDAARGVAPKPSELNSYAMRLGLGDEDPIQDGVVHLSDSGYVRVQWGAMVAILDVAPIGPDYLPGHAHADTLSFELSLYGARVLVNSGTSCYGADSERIRQRGTAAHTTVVVNGADSSEVWGGFRVARRARPQNLEIVTAEGHTIVACSHDGYKRLRCKPVHRREWRFTPGMLDVRDAVPGAREACSMWHFGEGVSLKGEHVMEGTLPRGQGFTMSIDSADMRLSDSTLHPEFGLSVRATLLECRFRGTESRAIIQWS